MKINPSKNNVWKILKNFSSPLRKNKWKKYLWNQLELVNKRNSFLELKIFRTKIFSEKNFFFENKRGYLDCFKETFSDPQNFSGNTLWN